MSAVAILAAASLFVFFRNQGPLEGSQAGVDSAAVSEQYDVSDDLAYYNAVADEYLLTMPADKVVVARWIDPTHHYLYYFERSARPSFYIYDLESFTTSVIMGPHQPAVAFDGTTLAVGTVIDWQLVDDWLAVIAVNADSDVTYPTAVVGFMLNLSNNAARLLSYGTDAYFPNDSQMVVNKAVVQHRGFLGLDEVYVKSPITYDL